VHVPVPLVIVTVLPETEQALDAATPTVRPESVVGFTLKVVL
jgi:hypothetical protein